jgi:hypothetical protein
MKSNRPIPLAWGKALTVEETEQVRQLREEGCDCEFPTLAVGSKRELLCCFNCGTIVHLKDGVPVIDSKVSPAELSARPLELNDDDLHIAT